MDFKQFDENEKKMQEPAESNNIKPEFNQLLHSETEKIKVESKRKPKILFSFIGTVRALKAKLKL